MDPLGLRAACRLAAVLGVLFAPSAARAQLFSPGPLSKAHAELEGLNNCTKCHPQGGKLDPGLCFECHEPIAKRVRAKRGYHGRMAENRCEKCHHEHRGRDFLPIRWEPREFDHGETGWTLEGAHRDTDCEDCHDPRLIVDREVRARLERPLKERTWLGLGEACSSCHFDEHRGQLSADCARCHDARAFAPASGFDHAKSDFPLRGAHRRVRCQDCHAEEADPRPTAFPASRSETFARYAPVAHEACTDCHTDPHQGRFGPDCESCHDERSWSELKEGQRRERSFHDETRYPLEGGHREVRCESCHLPLGKRKAVYKGLAFGRCLDCHLDAHAGEVKGDCDGCHRVASFYPSTFALEEHARVWPLERDHAATPCAGCHVERPNPALSRDLRRALARRARKPPMSRADLDPKGERCLDCHQDEHRGQLGENCTACHPDGAWSADHFDHAAARFRLEGAHAAAACVDCHQRPKPNAPVRYRPVELRCDGCHPDPHLGQLDAEGQDCDRCHGLERFELASFDHDALTRYPLEGKHREVKCDRCHPSVPLPGGGSVVKYRPLSTACADCHADFHKGAFRGYR